MKERFENERPQTKPINQANAPANNNVFHHANPRPKAPTSSAGQALISRLYNLEEKMERVEKKVEEIHRLTDDTFQYLKRKGMASASDYNLFPPAKKQVIGPPKDSIEEGEIIENEDTQPGFAMEDFDFSTLTQELDQ